MTWRGAIYDMNSPMVETKKQALYGEFGHVMKPSYSVTTLRSINRVTYLTKDLICA